MHGDAKHDEYTVQCNRRCNNRCDHRCNEAMGCSNDLHRAFGTVQKNSGGVALVVTSLGTSTKLLYSLRRARLVLRWVNSSWYLTEPPRPTRPPRVPPSQDKCLATPMLIPGGFCCNVSQGGIKTTLFGHTIYC